MKLRHGVEREHRERRIMDSEKAMLRSQSGPGAGLALSATLRKLLLSDSASLVPGVASASLPFAPPSCLSHLSMWPSNRCA